MIEAPPRYQEWLEFCFGQFEGALPVDTAWSLLSESSFDADDIELATLIRATLLRSGTDLVRYSDTTLAIGLTVLFYPEPSPICEQLCSPNFPPLARRNVVSVIDKLYLQCLDRRQLPLFTGDDVDDPRHELASRVFMLWDMSPLPYRCDCRTDVTLVSALHRSLACSSEGCLQSVVHGLGHMGGIGRAKQHLEELLAAGRSELSHDLRAYAFKASMGDIL